PAAIPVSSSWSSVITTIGTPGDWACALATVSRPLLSGSDKSSSATPTVPDAIRSKPSERRSTWSKVKGKPLTSDNISSMSRASPGLSSISNSSIGFVDELSAMRNPLHVLCKIVQNWRLLNVQIVFGWAGLKNLFQRKDLRKIHPHQHSFEI